MIYGGSYFISNISYRTMPDETYEDLLKVAERPDFDVFQCIDQLKEHGDNIGVHHYLVKKLYKYSYLEVEFYIPQLVQLLVSFETDSMALSDFLLDYCARYPHFCLITFWNSQAYIYELKNDPESVSFHVVRNFVNELQNIMFNQDSWANGQSSVGFRENLHPALVLSGMIATSIAIPGAASFVKPLIESQGRQQKSLLFKLANFHKSLTRNLTLKNRGRVSSSGDHSNSDNDLVGSATISRASTHRKSRHSTHIEGATASETLPRTMSMQELDSNDDLNYHSDYSLERNLKINTKIRPKRSNSRAERPLSFEKSPSPVNTSVFAKNLIVNENQGFHSLPDLRNNSVDGMMEEMSVITPTVSGSSSASIASLDVQETKPSNSGYQINQLKLSPLTQDQKVKLLHVNYFKKETEFMISLQNISMRLSQVPKEARLTSLRAELSIINNTLLPAEIDIPQLLPISSFQNKKFHRILKLNVNEAFVLNSAERVPFLLLIEYLSEDMDFDPSSDNNKHIFSKINNESTNSINKRNRYFSDSPRMSMESIHQSDRFEVSESNVDEADLGDMSVVAISNEQSFISRHLNNKQVDDMSNLKGFAKMRVSQDLNLVPGSPKEDAAANKPYKKELSQYLDTKELSTQIRIAAVMLQQLEKSNYPNSEQAVSIRTRIIDSMKSLQNKFDNIDYLEIRGLASSADRKTSTDAGERKLENDFKLSEDWHTKKNRIRQASSYGHLKNWDLCSVIAKNGDDLPQEAFACQLITIISNIWKANDVAVITKTMKILITSANSGLVETINNAMSIHSIKKTLTDLSLKRGENPKGKVATLKEYFLKVYGAEDTYKYKRAQDNFARSLAAYSIICYILQIKDRHNGNIMLDNEGHIIHIDFGFLLSNSPGSMGFEAAPFKLTFEYIDVLGGIEGSSFVKFKDLCKDCFKTIRKNCDQLINIIEVMQKDSSLPCFKNGPQTSILFKQRLQLEMNDEECDLFVENILIGKSLGSMYTRLYDQFQLITQGIYN